MLFSRGIFAVLFFVGLLFLTSCDQEEDMEISPGRQLYLEAIEAVEFECPNISTEVFFEGRLNGDPICYGEKVDDYTSYIRRGEGVQLSSYDGSGNRVDGSWVEFGFKQESYTHLKEELVIFSPTDPNSSSLLDLVNTYITSGEQPIRDELNPLAGFNIKIVIPYDLPDIDEPGKRLFSLQTATGSQANSQLEIVALEIQETESFFEYDLTLELNCTLYNEINDATDGEYFGELTDGIMRIQFAIPR